MKGRQKVALFGSAGSMGRRYTAILNWLGHHVLPIEVDDSFGESLAACEDADAIIVASPTETHVDICRGLLHLEKPILCEKPITKNVFELNRFLETLKHFPETRFQMVNQYKYMTMPGVEGLTKYDFYNSGKDGIYWDCINIIGLAKGEVKILDKSPFWQCQINGFPLSRGKIDHSYIEMITDWLLSPFDNLEYIYESHLKVHGMLNEKSLNRNSSAFHQ